MKRKVYISRNYKTVQSAGGKAKTDVELILKKLGYENIGLSQSVYSSKVVNFFRNLFGVFKAFWCMPACGLLFLQYPMKKYYSFMCLWACCRKTKVVTLVHDLGCFRRRKLTKEQDIQRLNRSDYILVQTPRMGQWLKENHYQGEILTLGIWDYLSDFENPVVEKRAENRSFVVNYMGTLSRKKCGFLEKVGPHINNYQLNVYGKSSFEETVWQKSSRLCYQGVCSGDHLIKSIPGDFGLVWDGDSLDTCSGNFGAYLQYNSPHKIALYVRCHLPLIIWEDAAMASFIEKEGIGITVSSLKELDEVLTSTSVEKYNLMKKRVIHLSKSLQGGGHLSQGVDRLEKELLGGFKEQKSCQSDLF